MKVSAYSLLERVRQQKPLVHHLTNWVTIYDCAQILKSMGASPVMAHAPEEASEMAQLASAVVLNIGTLTSTLIQTMKAAAASANHKGIPVILDACGVGSTSLRDRACFELLDSVRINVLKGNASEIARLAGVNVRTRGVDASDVAADLVSVARKLAKTLPATVVITGPEDIVASASRTFRIANGHPLMAQVVGTGCMAASVIGAFSAVEKNLPLAAASALCCFEIAAELAAESSGGPGSFKTKLFDSFHSLDQVIVESRQRILLAD